MLMIRRIACGLVWLALAGVYAQGAEPLTIVNAAIRQMEDGAPLPPGFTCSPGEILFFSFQVTGYRAADEKIRLSYEVNAVDPAGVRIIEPIKGAVDATLAPQDK